MKIYPVENNIPRTSKGEAIYPFGAMAVDDSFKVDGSEKDVRTLRSAASMYAARTGTKFSIKKYEDGYRCWRVK